LGKADLHIHSSASDGMSCVGAILEHVQENTDLDVIAITDHDAVDGALEAIELAERSPHYRFKVIFGTEITTAMGRHLLAYFVRPPYPTAPLPKLKSYPYTIEMIHEMGGIVAVPHPTVMWTPSGGYRYLLGLLRKGLHIDAIEVCNAAPGARGKEAKIREFNERDFHLAELGGSDAHHLSQIGSAFTTFAGHGAEDLARAIAGRSVRAQWGQTGLVTWQQHARQVFKSWVEKPTRGLRASLAE
jgi:predicted metal-dependent phosphoesterase TrpH